MSATATSIKPTFNCILRRSGEIVATATVTGRVAWMLLVLVSSGAKGFVPVERHGPRSSDYVFRLRKLGFAIETQTEAHDGAFSGTHARYILRDQVDVFGGNLKQYLASPEGCREFPNTYFAGASV